MAAIATIEALTALAFSTSSIAAAAQSGIFLAAVLGLPVTLPALATRAPNTAFRVGAKLVSLVAKIYLCAAVALTLLLWGSVWLMEERLSEDTLQFLLQNPLRAAMHLVQSDLALLSVLLCTLAFACIAVLKLQTRVTKLLQRESKRTIIAINLALLAALCAPLGIASNRNALLKASYGSFVALASGPVPELPMLGCGELDHLIPDSLPVRARGNPASRPPIIVIIIESLRSDILSTRPVAMPFLASIEPEGVFFDKDYSTSSHTDYANLAIWYSRYPFRSDHRLGYPYDAPWRGLSAFEYFKLNGYTTGYFSSQNEKWGGMINWLKRPGTDTFFDSEDYHGKTWVDEDDAIGLVSMIRSGMTTAGKVEDSVTLKRAQHWVDTHASKPFFLGMDLQNTHYSYVIPAGGAEPFKPDKMGFKRVYAAWPRDKVTEVRNRYLDAAWNVDRELESFVRNLQRHGVWDRALVMIVGDHGEAFYEHGFANHSGPLYDEVARSFAWVKFPKGDPRNGHPFSAPMSHVDLIPLAVSVAGLPPWPGFQGIDPWQRTRAMPIFLAANALVWQIGMVKWPWKLLVETFPNHQRELYDLERDPGERHNLFSAMPSKAARLTRALEQWRSCQIDYYRRPSLYSRFDPPHYGVMDREEVLGDTNRHPPRP